MSFTNTNNNNNNNKTARWAALLELFCIPLTLSNQKASRKAGPTADITIRLGREKPAAMQDESVIPTIIYEEPKSHPRPSTAPGAMFQPEAPTTIKGSGRQNSFMKKFSNRQATRLEQEPISEVAPFLLYSSPVEPKRCHKRWSSASMAPQDIKNRLRSMTTTEDATETAVITIGLMTEGPTKPRSLDRSTSAPTPLMPHVYNCARSSARDSTRDSTKDSTSSHPHTLPFPKSKMQNIPLPTPLPPTLKTTPCKRNSLSHVSNWVLFKEDDTHLHANSHPTTVKAAISECFANSPLYNASTTTVNTLGLDTGHGIMSSWYVDGKEMGEEEEEHYRRRTLILENKTYAPLSGTASAA